MEKEFVLKIEHSSKHFDAVKVFLGLSLQLKANEIVAILGPSGCGKSTLLRCIVGLEKADSGTILIAHHRGTESIGYLFQNPILYPHLNTAGNIALGFSERLTKQEKKARIEQELISVELGGFETRAVESLSGGEAQRVALVRALLGDPKVLLLDEPFSALDYFNKQHLTKFLKDSLFEMKKYSLLVTHDIQEAVLFSNKIYLLNPNNREKSQVFLTEKKDQKELILEILGALKT